MILFAAPLTLAYQLSHADIGEPFPSPDGKRLVYEMMLEGHYQLKPDGSDVKLVANTEGRATEPRWSTDGKTIFFTNCKKVDHGIDCAIMSAPIAH